MFSEPESILGLEILSENSETESDFIETKSYESLIEFLWCF